MNDVPGDKRIITPPMLGEKISLSLGHTSTFVFIGTKGEIVEWFRTVGHTKTVQAVLFYDRPMTDPLAPKVDIVFDLFPYPNPDLSWVQWSQSFYRSDPTLEIFRLEIRPEQPKLDADLEPLYRMYAKNGVNLGEMSKGLEKRWSQPPSKSYLDMAKEMFMEREDVDEHAKQVADEAKRIDEESREVDLEDIVVSAPKEMAVRN
ncbi:hypothetical protein BGW38_009162 [Lunasporangiospora selenospora]|uniref:Uncharacterized protein n=1 Tax=Lunasporangiospora selenospora TaxID=979761 RepID=A0A9P6FXJ5_9FUNG|nr:hypothetical protein BGW38_009162 [Lunasporangiospora selenospora]